MVVSGLSDDNHLLGAFEVLWFGSPMYYFHHLLVVVFEEEGEIVRVFDGVVLHLALTHQLTYYVVFLFGIVEGYLEVFIRTGVTCGRENHRDCDCNQCNENDMRSFHAAKVRQNP